MRIRSLQIELDRLEGRKTRWWVYALSFCEEKWHRLLVKCRYYDVRNFLRNIPHFTKQAWNYRDFDHSYTLECFVQNLERLGDGLKRWGNCTLSERNYRRCKFAAHLLRQAYEDDFIWKDKSYSNWSKNNEIYFDEIKEGEHVGMFQMKHKRKYPEDYSNKMWKIIDKRHRAINKARKEEAWAYVHKYLEMWWD